MKTYFVVTGVIKHKGKVLILKKGYDDYNYPGRWSFCSGFVREFEAAEDAVIREIKEETGLNAKILKKGSLLEVKDNKHKKAWIVVAFLCRSEPGKVKLDHENVAYRWISYKDIEKYKTVPGLEKDLKVLELI